MIPANGKNKLIYERYVEVFEYKWSYTYEHFLCASQITQPLFKIDYQPAISCIVSFKELGGEVYKVQSANVLLVQ